MPAFEPQEFSFAGKFIGIDDREEHLLMVEVNASATHILGFKLNGSFVTKVSDGWLFVEGARQLGTHRRSALFDDGEFGDVRANALVSLGVKLLSEAEAQCDVENVGHAIHNITVEERARAASAHARSS